MGVLRCSVVSLVYNLLLVAFLYIEHQQACQKKLFFIVSNQLYPIKALPPALHDDRSTDKRIIYKHIKKIVSAQLFLTSHKKKEKLFFYAILTSCEREDEQEEVGVNNETINETNGHNADNNETTL